MTPLLSAFLIVRDEARDLPACLKSLAGLADEIVVVDSGSRDATLDIARQAGARVFSRDFSGFGSQKQFALDQCAGQWALSIDADERVTPELADAIRQATRGSSPVAGFEIKRHMFFLGRRLRFGGVGSDWVIRLFKRAQGRFSPKEIHEQILVSGPVERLPGHLDHYSYATLEEYLAKIPEYTKRSARERWEKGKRFAWWHHLRPGWELFHRIVLKGAWLDGQTGLTYAALSAHAAWLRSVQLKELESTSHE